MAPVPQRLAIPMAPMGGPTSPPMSGYSLCLISMSEPGDGRWVYFRRLTENKQGDLLVTFPLGPFKTPVTFLVDTEAQMSALNANTTGQSGIVPDKNQIWVTDVFGDSKPQPTDQVKCWLLGDTVIETQE